MSNQTTSETDQVVKALNRIADAIIANAEATHALAMATAGEFDDVPEGETGSLSD